MELRHLWKKLRPQKRERVPFYENSLMQEAFASREPGAIDFMHFSTEALQTIAASEAGTMRSESARSELGKRRNTTA